MKGIGIFRLGRHTLFESEAGKAADGRALGGHEFVQFLQENLLALGPVGGGQAGGGHPRRAERHRRPADAVLHRRVLAGLQTTTTEIHR